MTAVPGAFEVKEARTGRQYPDGAGDALSAWRSPCSLQSQWPSRLQGIVTGSQGRAIVAWYDARRFHAAPSSGSGTMPSRRTDITCSGRSALFHRGRRSLRGLCSAAWCALMMLVWGVVPSVATSAPRRADRRKTVPIQGFSPCSFGSRRSGRPPGPGRRSV